MRNNTIALVVVLILVALTLYVVLPLPHPSWLVRSENPATADNFAGLKLGLDLEGGTQVMLEADVAEGQALAPGAIDTAKRIVENRVNGLGVSEAVVQKQGDTRIIAELPGVSNPDQAVETIRSTGQLEFVDLHGLPDTYLTEYVKRVMAISSADVQRMVRTYLRPENMAIVVVGDKKTVEEQVKPYTSPVP